jgi:hypothetical protein
MATVKAPLMSLDASGTIGRSIVFSNWKGINYVRRHAVPANPNNPSQVAVRQCLKALAQAWAGIGATPQGTWDDYITGKTESPFNGFVGYNAIRFRDGLGFADTYPYAATGTAPGAPTTTVTGAVRAVNLSIADGADPGDFWMIHTGSTGFTPAWSNVLAIVPRVASPTVYSHTPVAAGTYYYRVRGVAWNAALGALEAEKSGTATA